MKRPKTLSAAFVNTVKDPGRYGDGRGGHGLKLLVKPMTNGRVSKSWIQRLRINGKAFDRGLGGYPVVTLADARRKALENRRAVEAGQDPRVKTVLTPTFGEAAETVLKMYTLSWKDGSRYSKIWISSLERYAMPRLGNLTVDKVSTADVLGCLAPIWVSKTVTAQKVRRRISAVMKWAIAQGYRVDDPSGDALAAALPKVNGQPQHRRALPHAKVADALETVRESGAWEGTKLAFEFLTLTATRSAEVRLAKWGEIDGRVWTIPAERMKAGKAHVVPLSDAALDVLSRARQLADDNGLIFPSVTGRALSDSTVSKLLREHGVDCVPHSMRSSFRDWCAENDVSRELAEQCLAHNIGNAVEMAYRRSNLLELRAGVMESWGRYLYP